MLETPARGLAPCDTDLVYLDILIAINMQQTNANRCNNGVGDDQRGDQCKFHGSTLGPEK